MAMQLPNYDEVKPVSMVEYANQYADLANRKQERTLNDMKIQAMPEQIAAENRINGANADLTETKATREKHALLSQMAKASLSQLDKSGLPEGSQERQQALEKIIAPLRPTLSKLFNKPEMLTNPADEKALRSLAGMSLGDGAGGYHPPIPTNLGYAQYAEDGTYQPITIGGKTAMPVGADVELARNKEAAKQQERILNVTNPDESVSPMRAGDAIGSDSAFNTMHGLMGVESDYNPDAISPTGAVGATQILPTTAADPGYGVKPINLKSIRDQVRGGSDYLLGLMDHYIGKGMEEKDAYKMALKAYNQGVGGADKPEAAQYADKVMAKSGIKSMPIQEKKNLEVETEIKKEKAKQEMEQNNPVRIKAKADVSNLLNDLEKSYSELDKSNSIHNDAKGAGANLLAEINTSTPGLAISKMVGAKSKSVRNDIETVRRTLMPAIMKATGMTGSQLNSDAELQNFMKQLTDPNTDISTVNSQINRLRNMYGNGAAIPSTSGKVKFLGFE
jgi:hypothetical protein